MGLRSFLAQGAKALTDKLLPLPVVVDDPALLAAITDHDLLTENFRLAAALDLEEGLTRSFGQELDTLRLRVVQLRGELAAAQAQVTHKAGDVEYWRLKSDETAAAWKIATNHWLRVVDVIKLRDREIADLKALLIKNATTARTTPKRRVRKTPKGKR